VDGGIEVAILLLTCEQRDLTLRCLESLGRGLGAGHRVWLWDNGSTDGTRQAVAERFPEVCLAGDGVNLGVASGRNALARLALEEDRPDFLFFLDNDMTVEPDFLPALLAPFTGDARLAQTTGKIRQLEQPERLYGAGGCGVDFTTGATDHVGWGELDGGQHDTPCPCLPSGGLMMVRSAIFEELGGFDPLFDPYGPEDLDFGLRARAAGYHALYVPTAVVYHPASPGRTFAGGARSWAYLVNRVRQWLRFLHRHGSRRERVAFYLLGGPRRLVRLVGRRLRRGMVTP
jgi:GT2 family glycosyltransferase